MEHSKLQIGYEQWWLKKATTSNSFSGNWRWDIRSWKHLTKRCGQWRPSQSSSFLSFLNSFWVLLDWRFHQVVPHDPSVTQWGWIVRILYEIRCNGDMSRPVLRDEHNYIYTSGNIGMQVKCERGGRHNVEVDASSGSCDLLIKQLSVEDAGTYTCRRDNGEYHEMELIILASKRTCESNPSLADVLNLNLFICQYEQKNACSVTILFNIKFYRDAHMTGPRRSRALTLGLRYSSFFSQRLIKQTVGYKANNYQSKYIHV